MPQASTTRPATAKINKTVWSKDGRTISLYAGLGDENAAPKVFKVAELLE